MNNKFENIDKYLEYVGKDIYVIENIAFDHPYIKAVRINSLEIYSNGTMQLKTNNEGSYWPQYESMNFFLSREDAENKLKDKYSPTIIDTKMLKECPKCHGTADIKEYDHHFFIECHDCGLQTKRFYKLRDAFNNWNDRKE